MSDKNTLQTQLSRLTQDGLNIQGAIAKFQQDLQNLRQQIADTERTIDRHTGALNYNGVLAADLKKQLEEIEKAEIAKS